MILLQAANPIALGKTRAREQSLGSGSYCSECVEPSYAGEKVLCLQIHGDAAFTGQVSEAWTGWVSHECMCACTKQKIHAKYFWYNILVSIVSYRHVENLLIVCNHGSSPARLQSYFLQITLCDSMLIMTSINKRSSSRKSIGIIKNINIRWRFV